MFPALEKMNGAAFPSPTAEMAEMNRIHYELQYTEGISQRMRVPEMLKVAPYTSEERDDDGDDDDVGVSPGNEVLHTAMMQVPDRIVITGEQEDAQFSRPRDLDLIQSTPLKTLALKTPPRVLTLNERPLDFLEMEQTSDEGVSGARGVLSFLQSSTRRAYQQLLEVLDENQRSKPSLRGGSTCSNLQHDGRFALDTTLEGGEDLAVADATALRRQIIKLNRRLQLLEEENKERGKREMIMYSITVAFWLINSWVWLRR